MTGERMPSPGPSFARAEPLRLRGPAGEPGPRVRLGMLRPSIMDDGWWLTTLWVEDDEGVVEARTVAPVAGPPPAAPLQVIGPTLSNALMGLLDQEDGRQLIRLRMPPADDEAQLWRRPLLLLVARALGPRPCQHDDHQPAGWRAHARLPQRHRRGRRAGEPGR